jgi:hypothetical protein
MGYFLAARAFRSTRSGLGWIFLFKYFFSYSPSRTRKPGALAKLRKKAMDCLESNDVTIYSASNYSDGGE